MNKWNLEHRDRKNELNKVYYEKRKKEGKIKKYSYLCDVCDIFVTHLSTHNKTKKHQSNIKDKIPN